MINGLGLLECNDVIMLCSLGRTVIENGRYVCWVGCVLCQMVVLK